MPKITLWEGPTNLAANAPGLHRFSGREAQVALAVGVPPAAFVDTTFIPVVALTDPLAEANLVAQALADLIDDTSADV